MIAVTLDGKNILVTGGTGSFGKRFVEIILQRFKPKKLIVFSRDELKQSEMESEISRNGAVTVRYVLGNVRNRESLHRAFSGVDIVVHAAALKQIPSCERNAFESVLTNIIGTRNVIDVAIDQRVEKVLTLSTDKAVSPESLYGATKLCAERLLVEEECETTRLSCARYGNVIGSRGSVIPLFLKQRKGGKITITDPNMTRFWITLDQGVEFVLNCLDIMKGREIFVPKIPSMKIGDLAGVLSPDCETEIIGARPGEKIHELLLSKYESPRSVETDGMYIIYPTNYSPDLSVLKNAKPLPDDFEYSSANEDIWLSGKELLRLMEKSK